MIDPDLPLELDDGREVVLIGKDTAGTDYDCVTVRVTGPVRRGIPNKGSVSHYAYYIKDGVWAGGTAETYYVLQNAVRPEMYVPEDWS